MRRSGVRCGLQKPHCLRPGEPFCESSRWILKIYIANVDLCKSPNGETVWPCGFPPVSLTHWALKKAIRSKFGLLATGLLKCAATQARNARFPGCANYGVPCLLDLSLTGKTRMPGKPFFDTNILIYALAENDPRNPRAEELLASGGVLSVQILNEFVAVARRKILMSWSAALEALDRLLSD